jgi:hypothetical protein
MRPTCSKIMRNGVRCRYGTNGGSEHCGLHGGITNAQWRKMKSNDKIQDLCSCMEAVSIDSDCMICLDKVDKKYFTVNCCKQTFCKNCLGRWLSSEFSCPHCRNQFVKKRACVVDEYGSEIGFY